MTEQTTVKPPEGMVAALRQADAWFASLRDRLVQLREDEVTEVFTELLRIRGTVEGLGVADLVQAEDRGVVAASVASGTPGWVQARALDAEVALTGAQARAWGACAREAQAPDMAVFAHAVTTGRVGVSGGAVLARELRTIREHVPAATWDACAGEVVGYAVAGASARDLMELRDVVITQYGDTDWLNQRQARAHRHRDFTGFRAEPDGLYTARLALDPESHAMVEAALNALSAPNPAHPRARGDDGADAGRDTRSAGQRRADALVDLCAVVGTDPQTLGGLRPTSATRAQVRAVPPP